MSLDSQIEAILFYSAEPVQLDFLVKALNIEGDEDAETVVRRAIDDLEVSLKDRGVRLIMEGDKITLGTAPEVAELIENIKRRELDRDLGKAGLETLTIVLYRGPVSKSEIDYVRGVNSGFILRNLLIRGLIERLPNPNDKRTFLYTPSIDALSHIGISRVSELPQYNEVAHKIDTFEEDFEDNKKTDENK